LHQKGRPGGASKECIDEDEDEDEDDELVVVVFDNDDISPL
jgi:hypothetical protein